MIPPIFFFLLFLIPFSPADDYLSPTGSAYGYMGATAFNSPSLVTFGYPMPTIASSRFAPLYADIDRDNLTEAVIYTNHKIRFYENKTYDADGVLNLDSSSSYEGLTLFDFGDDGYIEIIIADTNDAQIDIYQHNSTNINTISNLQYEGLPSGGNIMIGCSDVNDICGAVANKLHYQTGDRETNAFTFNDTNISSNYLIVDNVNGCPPQIPYLGVGNLNASDGDDEYAFAFYQPVDGGDDLIRIGAFSHSPDWSAPHMEFSDSITSGYDYIDSIDNTVSCNTTSDMRVHFTSAEIINWDGSTANGLEFAVGYPADEDETAVVILDGHGSSVNSFPLINFPTGEVISNLIFGTFFTDVSSAGHDLCLMVYEMSQNQIKLFCGSEFWNAPFKNSDEFVMSLRGNVSTDIHQYSSILHSVQAVDNTNDGVDPYEVATSYGIFKLEEETSFIDAELTQVYDFDADNSTLIPLDYDDNGLADMIFLYPFAGEHLDDQYTNEGCKWNDYTTNPDYRYVWKNGTDVTISVEVSDAEGDDCQIRGFLYYDEAYVQDSGWSAEYSSGSWISLDFVANHTISNGVIRIDIRDDVNLHTNDTLTISFDVDVEGIDQNDGLIYRHGDRVPAVNVSGTGGVTFPVSNNSITVMMNRANEVSGIGTTVLWLFVMFGIGVAVVWGMKDQPIGALMGTLIGGEAIFFIIGVILGFIGVGILITLLILGVIAIGIWLSRKFTAGAGG